MDGLYNPILQIYFCLLVISLIKTQDGLLIILMIDSNTIVKTTNCGINWVNQYNISKYNEISSIFFIDPETGWVLYDSATLYFPVTLLLKTTNGGLNWNLFIQGYRKLF